MIKHPIFATYWRNTMKKTYKDLKLRKKSSIRSEKASRFFFEEVLMVNNPKLLAVLCKNLVLIFKLYVQYWLKPLNLFFQSFYTREFVTTLCSEQLALSNRYETVAGCESAVKQSNSWRPMGKYATGGGRKGLRPAKSTKRPWHNTASGAAVGIGRHWRLQNFKEYDFANNIYTNL